MTLNEVLAKSNPEESLIEHTKTVLKIWDKLRTRYSEVIDSKTFWRDSFYSVLFHDFGKICNNFQDVINKRKAVFDDERVRHEFFSGMFLLGANSNYYTRFPLSLVAIFSHHKPFSDRGGFNDHIAHNRHLRHSIDKNLIDEFITFANEQARKYNIDLLKVNGNFKYYILNKYSTLELHYKCNFYRTISKKNLKKDKRKDYIFFKSFLNISDWTASGHSELEPCISFSQSYLKERIIKKLINDGITDIARRFQFRNFQIESNNKNNVIAIAPTGSGKTEAALLWASQKRDWERIIYLLPTRVTSNAIFQRLLKYFSFETVGLIHSTARLFQKEQVDNDYDQKKYFRDKSFFKNINICTIDQILTIGFNLGFWEVKTLHLLRARIIIDEIHLYAPYTLGLIIASIKYLKEEFDARFYIMTATMPTKLLSLLSNTIKDIEIIRDTELLDASRNKFEVRTSQLDEILPEIASHIKSNKKVLIVVNSVDKAIELYDYLKVIANETNVDAICYHSRFINKHRNSKEQAILNMDKAGKGGVLVATQVVEVSLDIDFDILFTENAPIDAIVQRAGRVNRKRNKEDSKVIITQHYEVSEKIYEGTNILKKTFVAFGERNGHRLTENDLNKLVDTVYEEMDIEGNDDFNRGLKKYQQIQYQFDWIKDLTSDEKIFTREGLDTVTVIPDCYYEELYDETNHDEINKYQLNISKWRYHSLGKEEKKVGKLKYIYVDAPYSYEKGLEFKKKETNEIIL